VYAQTVKTKTLTLKGDGEIFLLREIGGIITESGDSITVDMIMPEDARAEDYRSVDIRVGDLIKMANGKTVTSIKMLEGLYNSLAIGDQLKLGIFRDRQMVIASLTKADPDKLPGKMMVMTGPARGGIETALIDAGLLLKETGTGFVVDEVIDNMLVDFTGDTPQKGDALLKIQEHEIKTADELKRVLDQVKEGENVDLILSREGEEVSASFIKPKSENCAAGKKIKIKR
jgi:PDZ domain-containing secreted protein